MSGTAIYPCASARDEDSDAALSAAFKKGGWDKVTRLYRTGDLPDEQCWVRGDGWSLAMDLKIMAKTVKEVVTGGGV